ncbi:MAG: hypothetical protein ACK5OR_05830 [Betaproteobacteria bacterium]
MRTPSRTVAAALAESPAAALLERLAATQSAAAAIADAVAELTPGLNLTQPGTADLHGETLLLNAPTAAAAAKLRQAIPGLLALLHQQGVEVNQIRLRVQPCGSAQPEAHVTQISDGPDTQTDQRRDAARRFAPELAARLPDSALGRAAERLQKKLDAQSGR